MNISPATTGETENGRSIRVIRIDFPRNLNFAMAHAAANPNNTLSGTAIAATVKVNRIAAQESGWVKALQ